MNKEHIFQAVKIAVLFLAVVAFVLSKAGIFTDTPGKVILLIFILAAAAINIFDASNKLKNGNLNRFITLVVMAALLVLIGIFLIKSM